MDQNSHHKNSSVVIDKTIEATDFVENTMDHSIADMNLELVDFEIAGVGTYVVVVAVAVAVAAWRTY